MPRPASLRVEATEEGRGPDGKTPWDTKDWSQDKETSWTSDEESPLSNSDPVGEQGSNDVGECNGGGAEPQKGWWTRWWF